MERSAFEGLGGQVVELAEAVDTLVVESGKGMHVDGQEVDRQGRQEMAARFRSIRHAQGMAGPGDAGGAVGGEAVERDADLRFPIVGYAAHQVGDDAGFVGLALIVVVNLHIGDTLPCVIDGIADVPQAGNGGAPLMGVQREVGRDGNGLGTAGERGVQRHFGMDAQAGSAVHHALKRSVGVVDDQRVAAQAGIASGLDPAGQVLDDDAGHRHDGFIISEYLFGTPVRTLGEVIRSS